MTTRCRSVVDFRFHDYRHNLSTKVLRKTGNLKLVQKMLNHASIRTTTKYAHVLPDEVSASMESVAQDWRQKSDEKSPTKSPTIKRKAS
jgi:site-specific recombinase XerD